MEINDYLRILYKRGWIVIAVAIITAVSAYGFSKLQKPIYSATVKLSVLPSRPDWGSSNSLKDLLRNYAETIRTHTMAQEVIDEEHLDTNTSALLGKLFVNPDSSTFTVAIEARDHDPEVAMNIVNRMALIFSEDRAEWNQRRDKRDQVEVRMLDSVYNLGASQYSPKTQINTLAGGLFGVLVGILVLFFLEWLERDTIRTAEDVERLLGATVLGAIPAESQASSRSTPEKSGKLIPELGGTN